MPFNKANRDVEEAPSRKTSYLLIADTEWIPDPRFPEQEEDGRIKPALQQIVSIGYLQATIETVNNKERFIVTHCRSGGNPGDSEATLLSGFWKMLDEKRPRIVTWGGRRFDWQAWKLRSMAHKIQAGGIFQAGDKWANYSQRFATNWHCDLMDVMSDHGASSYISLDEASKLMGFPGKGLSGFESYQVADKVSAGEIEDVRNHCELDCLNLFCVYLNHMLFTGRMDRDGYEASMNSLRELLYKKREEAPHFGAFLDSLTDSPTPSEEPEALNEASVAEGDSYDVGEASEPSQAQAEEARSVSNSESVTESTPSNSDEEDPFKPDDEVRGDITFGEKVGPSDDAAGAITGDDKDESSIASDSEDVSDEAESTPASPSPFGF